MLLTLLKALNTTDLQKVVGHLSLAPLDIDLLLYDAQESGEIAVDKTKGKITALKEPANLYYDDKLADKLVRMISRYDEQEANITRNRLEEVTLALGMPHGYPIHDFMCTMYALEQGAATGCPTVNRYEISVPEIKKKRPANTFVFYTLLPHQEFGSKAVNDFIAEWDKLQVEKK